MVQFQQNAWCDEQVMLFWINNMWKPLANQFKPTMLVADVHRAQNTETVKSKFLKIGTTLALIPGGCTNELQPLDRVFHGPLKKKIEKITDKHVHANRKQWLEGTFTASERRIIMTKWVGEAWSDTCKDQTDAVVKCFKSCGISNKIDGTEDHLIHFQGIDSYTFETEERAEDEEIGCFILDNDSDSDEDIPLAELKLRV